MCCSFEWLYKKNGTVSCVRYGYPWMPSWTKFGYGQISIGTVKHSFGISNILDIVSIFKLFLYGCDDTLFPASI